MENKKENPIELQIKAMSVDYFQLENRKNLTDVPMETNTQFDVEIELMSKNRIFIEKNLYQQTLTVKIFTKEKHTYLCEIVAVFDYLISNMQKFYVKEQNHYDLPKDIVVTLIATSYSTTRGLLSSKLSGTYLQSFTLPLVDPRLGTFSDS